MCECTPVWVSNAFFLNEMSSVVVVSEKNACKICVGRGEASPNATMLRPCNMDIDDRQKMRAR